MSWFPAEFSQWRVVTLGLLPYLGRAIFEPHLEGIAASPYWFLPRLMLGWDDKIKTHMPLPAIKPRISARSCTSQGSFYEPAMFSLYFERGLPALGIYLIHPILEDSRFHVPLSLQYFELRFEPRKFQFCDRLSTADTMIIVSSGITLGLILASALVLDGCALIAIVLTSLQSTMRSYTLRKRFYYSATRQSQARHEVVVITPENAFWVVSCDSICWDALINGRMHRLREFMTYPKTQLDGVTLLAQGFFFVLVANARTLSQILIVSAYIFLTFLHGILPPLAGNLNQIAFSPLYHYRACGAENSQAHQPQTEIQPSLARTVWYTIQLTGSACWIRPVRAIPDESGWNIWLDEARHQVSIKSSDWPAEGEKRRLVDKDENIYILPETPKPSVTIESVGLRLVPEEQW